MLLGIVACGGQTASGPPPVEDASTESGVSCVPLKVVCAGASATSTCGESNVWGAPVSCTPSAAICQDGHCICTPGRTACDGACVDDMTDSANCGGCGIGCTGTTSFCAQGACTSPPPSCQTTGDGLTNCGAMSESCCTSLGVPGGTYARTYVYDGGALTGSADPATVSGFRLDKFEVTVGRFRQFVNAWNGGWLPSAGSGKHIHLNDGNGLADTVVPGAYESGWATANNSLIAPTDYNLSCPNGAYNTTQSVYPTWTPAPGTQENLPINCVNWLEAYAFCIWDGGFLPSEAEWGYAAAGGNQQREYPWGSADPGTANQYAIYGCLFPDGTGDCTKISNIARVGTATAGYGLWGQLDLAGNVGEWSLDWVYHLVDPCVDCANLDDPPPPTKVTLGGDFEFSLLGGSYLDNPNLVPPENRSVEIGLRCARMP